VSKAGFPADTPCHHMYREHPRCMRSRMTTPPSSTMGLALARGRKMAGRRGTGIVEAPAAPSLPMLLPLSSNPNRSPSAWAFRRPCRSTISRRRSRHHLALRLSPPTGSSQGWPAKGGGEGSGSPHRPHGHANMPDYVIHHVYVGPPILGSTVHMYQSLDQ